MTRKVLVINRDLEDFQELCTNYFKEKYGIIIHQFNIGIRFIVDGQRFMTEFNRGYYFLYRM